MMLRSGVIAWMFVALCADPAVAGQSAQRRPNDPVALAEAGFDAIEERRFGDAVEAFTRAAKLAPKDPHIAFGVGYAAYLLGQFADARPWLERALALDPRVTQASIVLGQVLYREGRTAEAIAVYEAALKHAPGDKDLARFLADWRREAKVSDRFYEARGAHFSVRFEGPADDLAARRIVDLLEEAYWRIGQLMSTYPTNPVTVILYTREQFRDVTRSPEWAGGLYDGRIKIPTAGAASSDDLKRILEHEYVHAVVATIGGSSAPTWLNEGLATVLEPGGLEWAEQVLAKEPRRVPFSRLARGFGGMGNAEATVAYAQSARAVKRLLDMRGMTAVVGILQAVGRGVAFDSGFFQHVYITYPDFIATMERE
jgi:tetratricopeptide (TPR) repeat protein